MVKWLPAGSRRTRKGVVVWVLDSHVLSNEACEEVAAVVGSSGIRRFSAHVPRGGFVVRVARRHAVTGEALASWFFGPNSGRVKLVRQKREV